MAIQIDGAGTITGVNATGISAQPVFPGNVLQVVSTTKTDTFSTASESFVDVTGLSASITPTSATSKILVIVHVGLFSASSSFSRTCTFRILRDSTAVGVADAAGSRLRANFRDQTPNDSNHGRNGSFAHVDSPNTTSSVTYKLQIVTHGATVFFNRTATDSDGTSAFESRASASITLMEIAG